MREADLSLSNVEYVVISHLHEDHTGVANEFAHAIFIAGEGTRERMIGGHDSPFHSGVEPEGREITFEEDGEEGKTLSVGPFESSAWPIGAR